MAEIVPRSNFSWQLPYDVRFQDLVYPIGYVFYSFDNPPSAFSLVRDGPPAISSAGMQYKMSTHPECKFCKSLLTNPLKDQVVVCPQCRTHNSMLGDWICTHKNCGIVSSDPAFVLNHKHPRYGGFMQESYVMQQTKSPAIISAYVMHSAAPANHPEPSNDDTQRRSRRQEEERRREEEERRRREDEWRAEEERRRDEEMVPMLSYVDHPPEFPLVHVGDVVWAKRRDLRRTDMERVLCELRQFEGGEPIPVEIVRSNLGDANQGNIDEFNERQRRRRDEPMGQRNPALDQSFQQVINFVPTQIDENLNERFGHKAHTIVDMPGPAEPCMPYMTPKRLDFHKKRLLGNFRGIQGNNNSCYIDSLLTTMFLFNNDFDAMLSAENRHKADADPQFYHELKRIIQRMRTVAFVPLDVMGEWRLLLNRHMPGNNIFEDVCREQDPLDLYNILCDKSMGSPPLLKLRQPNGNIQKQAHLLLFPPPNFKKDEIKTVQELFDINKNDIVFDEPPSVLVVQLPRENGTKFDRVLPSTTLHTDVGKMILFGFLCIQQSHYVSYNLVNVENGDGRIEQEWVYFNSMADKPDGQHCIPEIRVVPEIKLFKNSDGVRDKLARGVERHQRSNVKRLYRYDESTLTTGGLPLEVRGIVEDIYVCFYRRPRDADVPDDLTGAELFSSVVATPKGLAVMEFPPNFNPADVVPMDISDPYHPQALMGTQSAVPRQSTAIAPVAPSGALMDFSGEELPPQSVKPPTTGRIPSSKLIEIAMARMGDLLAGKPASAAAPPPVSSAPSSPPRSSALPPNGSPTPAVAPVPGYPGSAAGLATTATTTTTTTAARAYSSQAPPPASTPVPSYTSAAGPAAAALQNMPAPAYPYNPPPATAQPLTGPMPTLVHDNVFQHGTGSPVRTYVQPGYVEPSLHAPAPTPAPVPAYNAAYQAGPYANPALGAGGARPPPPPSYDSAMTVPPYGTPAAPATSAPVPQYATHNYTGPGGWYGATTTPSEGFLGQGKR